jgi:hypothetical protein
MASQLFRDIDPVDFVVGKGWEGIVTQACERLEGLHMVDLVVMQIKEKFGGLRIYPHWENDDRRD